MATSGLYNYNVTGSDIITESLGLIGVYSPGESIDATESADVLRTLNIMLKSWQHKFGIWLYKDIAMFFQNDQYQYNLGLTGDHYTASFAKTEVATAAVSGASTVVVDSISDFSDTFDRDGIVTATTPAGGGAITLTGALVSDSVAVLSGQRKILIYSDADDSGVSFGITGQDANGIAVTETITGPNTTTVYSSSEYKTISSITIDGAGTGNIEIGQVGDHVGIEVDDGTIHWTFLTGTLSTTLSLVTALDDSTAIDNHVYSYTVRSPRPLTIMEARLHNSSDNETTLIIVGKNDYNALPNKTTEGTPNQIFYDKQLTSGVLNVWPEPNNVKEYLKFTAKLPIQYMNNATDDFEVAEEWFMPIAWNLAVYISPKYGKLIDPMLKMTANELLEDAMAHDSENTSTFIQIKRRYA